jgi:hypothetical protein
MGPVATAQENFSRTGSDATRDHRDQAEAREVTTAERFPPICRGRLLAVAFVLSLPIAGEWGGFAQSAIAVETENHNEKESRLKGQALGGLFNRWTFDQQKVNEAPTGFAALTQGDGSVASWTIRSDAEAPSSPNIVEAMSSCSATTCSQLLVASGFDYEYPDVSVRLRLPSEGGAGVGGIAFGVKDAKNFYAALVDLEAKTVTVIKVIDGRETVIGETLVTPKAVAWHSLRVQRNTIISKDFIETSFDGQMMRSVEDQTLGMGRVGLVVRGKTTLYFDSLHAVPLFSQRPLSAPAAY